MWSACAWACSSSEAAEVRSELARWRFTGLEPPVASDLRWVSLPVSGAVVSPSSPEASREEGCRSGLSSIMAELAVVGRFRLPAWDELEGEDILSLFGRPGRSGSSGPVRAEPKAACVSWQAQGVDRAVVDQSEESRNTGLVVDGRNELIGLSDVNDLNTSRRVADYFWGSSIDDRQGKWESGRGNVVYM